MSGVLCTGRVHMNSRSVTQKMGCRGLVVIRIDKNVVLQCYLSSDAQPQGFYAHEIATLLLSISGLKITPSVTIQKIVSTLKKRAGYFYTQPLSTCFGAHTNFPMIEWAYFLDFCASDAPNSLRISIHEGCGRYQNQLTVKEFAEVCNVQYQEEYKEPYFEDCMFFADNYVVDNEYVTVIDERGRPLVHFAVESGWLARHCKQIIDITFRDSGLRSGDRGSVADGIGCLTMQIIKMSTDLYIKFMHARPSLSEAHRYNIVALYPGDENTPVHHEKVRQTHGIFSTFNYVQTLQISKLEPEMPKFNDKRTIDEAGMQIVVKSFEPDDEDMEENISICKDQRGTLHFDKRSQMNIFVFEEGSYIGEYCVPRGDPKLKFEELAH